MGCPNDCCKLGWFKREIWFADLKRKDFVCGIGGFKWPFLVMKLVFLVYWISMWIYRQWDFHTRANAANSREYPDYLTNWMDTVILLHLFYSTILVLCNVSWDKLDDPAPWYYYPSQLFFNIAVVGSTLITAVYFALLYSGGKLDIGSIHAHIMNVVVMSLGFFFSGIPIRLFHFVYLWAFGWIYILATFIAFKVDETRDEVYNFLNWKDGKSDDWFLSSIDTSVMFIFGVFGGIHLVYYGLSELKMCLKRRILQSRNIDDSVQMNAYLKA